MALFSAFSAFSFIGFSFCPWPAAYNFKQYFKSPSREYFMFYIYNALVPWPQLKHFVRNGANENDDEEKKSENSAANVAPAAAAVETISLLALSTLFPLLLLPQFPAKGRQGLSVAASWSACSGHASLPILAVRSSEFH